MFWDSNIPRIWSSEKKGGAGKRISSTPRKQHDIYVTPHAMSTILLCSFLVSRFRLIVIFPSLCATKRPLQHQAREERKVSDCLLFVSVLNSFLSFFWHTLFFFCWHSFPISALSTGAMSQERWGAAVGNCGHSQRPPVKADGASLYGHSRQQRTAETMVTELGCGCSGSTAAVQARGHGL